MKTLVVGGTGFLGGAIVDAALTAGHQITVLSRGQTKRPQPKTSATSSISTPAKQTKWA